MHIDSENVDQPVHENCPLMVAVGLPGSALRDVLDILPASAVDHPGRLPLVHRV